MRISWQIGLLLVLASLRAAAGTTEIREVTVGLKGDKVTVDVNLTASVIPDVIIATNPDRLVLQLPNTAAPRKQQGLSVNHNGVKGIRVGLNSVAPPIARVVVDLNAAHPYSIAMSGKRITLTVLPIPTQTRPSNLTGRQGSSPSLMSRLWRRQPSVSAESTAGTVTIANVTLAPPSAKAIRTKFAVKYVAEGVAYLNGGRSSGLVPGMMLLVREPVLRTRKAGAELSPVIAELRIISVAQNSAVTEIHAPKRPLKPGDSAYLSAADVSTILAERASMATANWRVPGNAFTESPVQEGDSQNIQARSLSPEDSRLRARVGLDYSGIQSRGSVSASSKQRGMSVQADMTNIGGTHWNLQGYWRGRLTNNSQPLENTMQDYLDRTYTIQLYYDNPDSNWVAGIGRLYLPWAVSLDTIDGGYLGRRLSRHVIAGVFAGSTPDPASWHYQPDQQITGSFVNAEGGSYDRIHYSSTAGLALNLLKWRLDRPYLFLENSLSYSRYISVYHSLIVDDPQGLSTSGIRPGTGISRSYLTVHIQPHERIAFDLYHNYFRDVPTAATALIGTGLVDKLLYQGLSAGVRVEALRHFWIYTTLGRSESTGDTHRSLNQMYGATWSEIAHTGIRADLHYSKFDSPFARGDYRVLSLSRHLGDRVVWDSQLGQQSLRSGFTSSNGSMFFDTSFDTNLTSRAFLQSGYTISRGAPVSYDQWYVGLGYRLDVRGPVR